MTAIQSFAGLGEDLDLIWLAGFREDAERGWLVRAVTRGLNSGTLRCHGWRRGVVSWAETTRPPPGAAA